jgi:hypothetical protein
VQCRVTQGGLTQGPRCLFVQYYRHAHTCILLAARVFFGLIYMYIYKVSSMIAVLFWSQVI